MMMGSSISLCWSTVCLQGKYAKFQFAERGRNPKAGGNFFAHDSKPLSLYRTVSLF